MKRDSRENEKAKLEEVKTMTKEAMQKAQEEMEARREYARELVEELEKSESKQA